MFKFIDKIADILYGKLRGDYNKLSELIMIRRWLGVVGLIFVLFLFIDPPSDGIPNEHRFFFGFGACFFIWVLVKMNQNVSKKK